MSAPAQAGMAARLAGLWVGSALWHSRAGARRAARRVAHRAGRGRHPSGGAKPTEFDPFDPAVREDPYPAYRELLDGPPLHYSPRRALWYVVRYDDVRAAGRAHQELSSAEGVSRHRAHIPMMLTSDPPVHMRLRRLVAPAFTHDAVGRWRPFVEDLASQCVDRILAGGEADAIPLLAEPLPVAVIARLLGVPAGDLADFRRWSDKIVRGFDLGQPPGRLRKTVDVFGGTVGLHAYMAGQFDQLRADPGDDVLSRLVAPAEEGRLSRDELFWFALLLLVAGNETTTNLLGTMVLRFALEPTLYERLRRDPSLVPSAVEESLRHVSPIQGMYRTALRDYPVGDAVVPAGERVLLLFGAANRDARHYPDPDAFRLDRNPRDHVAFGSGIHFCLGAHLARLEAEVVLRELLERVQAIQLSGKPAWTDNPSLRGLARLPVRFVPAGDGAGP